MVQVPEKSCLKELAKKRESRSRRHISKFLMLILAIGLNAFLQFAAHPCFHIAAFIWPDRLY